jgi:DNA-binding response OmpR family regulator
VRALGMKYTVLQASDGLAASELLGKIAPPDLMIVDVMMPRIDGFSLATNVRKRPEFQSLPIIFLTAKTAAHSVIKGIQLGARHYLSKPFSVTDLLTKVDRILM